MNVKTRAHVIIEKDILREIDRLVGKKKRGSFISEAAKKELQRLNQISLLRKLKGIWKDEDHPDMMEQGGTEAWVRKQRAEDEKALRRKIA